ncbi:M3 family oligoendopeptidase [Candidatus Leptofilum sp.]|uniref:M3 family oligoendopeptidase n=1 Tax=Candidatus Leptofilum sp. TaxID=3241576 RepID=UPI003B5AF555
MISFDLPQTVDAINPREWATFAPYFAELAERPLTPENLRQWLTDWSDLTRLLFEAASLIYIEKSQDTTDEEKEQAFLDLINDVYPQAQVAIQMLKERLLAVDPDSDALDDMALVLRNMQNEASLFRKENIPLFTEAAKLENEYEKVTGALKATWDGEEKNLSQLGFFLNDKERVVRQKAWQTIADLWLSERETLNSIYGELLALRQQMAKNADLPDYRTYAFRAMGRFDYTPEDCLTFHEAIETAVVPAVRRILARKKERLGYDVLRPWDWVPERGTLVDDSDGEPLRPYQGQEALIQHSLNIFNQLDPQLGHHFASMAEDGLLDLDTRAGKALGGYCSSLPLRMRPFIFMNGVGSHDDVQTMLHEAGHAFHVFETADLPLIWQTDPPMEFCEVASMSMELLAAPYLTNQSGGFYTSPQAARARIDHLENSLAFLPYMAVVDAFQHWVYTHPQQAANASRCDEVWEELYERFIPGIDWDGKKAAKKTGWHRKPHIFTSPFYYIEYGMAQVGALQVWRNSLDNPGQALESYRRALAYGGTKTLPELFASAGAEFRFDTEMLTQLVSLIEDTTAELRKSILS